MEINPYESSKASMEAAVKLPVQGDWKSVIKYENTIDDIRAFNRSFIAQSPTIRNQKYFVIAIAGATALFVGYSLVPEVPVRAAIIGAVAFTIVFAFLYHFVHRYSIERQALRVVLEGSTQGILGPHELELNETSVTERTAVNESRHALSAIERIEETDEHAFLYISSLHAHVIPKRRVLVGDVNQFIEWLRASVARARDAKK